MKCNDNLSGQDFDSVLVMWFELGYFPQKGYFYPYIGRFESFDSIAFCPNILCILKLVLKLAFLPNGALERMILDRVASGAFGLVQMEDLRVGTAAFC